MSRGARRQPSSPFECAVVRGLTSEILHNGALPPGPNSYLVKPMAFEAEREMVRTLDLDWALFNCGSRTCSMRDTHFDC